jgi:hypothetical protein
MNILFRFLIFALFVCLCPLTAQAQDRLIYCNQPERVRSRGVLASAYLEPGKTYQVFYHYRNETGRSAEFVVALSGTGGGPLAFTARQGLADPTDDPPSAGEQAMARYFNRRDTPLVAQDGTAQFSYRLGHRDVASGVLTITAKTRAKLALYFGNNDALVPGAQTMIVDTPRCEVEIPLSKINPKQIYRIGKPESGIDSRMDGSYGMIYAFKLDAPVGSRVRVSFSPRGGQSGLVGTLNGALVRSPILQATERAVVCEAKITQSGAVLVTSPFGGVFYPVELTFELQNK